MGELRGVGLGFRPELAPFFVPGGGLSFTEAIVESLRPGRLSAQVLELAASGFPVVPHGVSLGLAGAQTPDPGRLRRLREAAEAVRAPLVSEHIAFVRSGVGGPHGGVLEAGHLVPPPRTRESLAVLVDNVRRAQEELPVPLALENIAANLRWPEDEFEEPDFLAELVSATGCLLLVDVANLFGSALARGTDPHAELRRLPWESVAYAHVAGGQVRDMRGAGASAGGGLYLDTHGGPILDEVVALAAEAAALRPGLGLLLEVDQQFDAAQTARNLAVVREAMGLGEVPA